MEEKDLKKAEVVKEEKVAKAEPSITEDELLKTIQELTDIAKAAGKEEEEEEEKEEEEEEKSYSDNFESDDTIEKAIEVSDFLAALVEQTETSIDGLGKSLNKIQKSSTDFNSKYIEGLSKLSEVIKGFGSKFDAIDERLKTIEQTPVTGPKTVMKSIDANAKPIEKAFSGEATIETTPRRTVIEALEKAVVDGKVPDKVLIGFEADRSYALDTKTKDILKSYIS